ncbi:hypothetical protein BH18VER1_BH18VER1_13900 [soil metagenome]
MAKELGIPRIVAVANKFRSSDDLAAIRNYAEKHGLEIVGEIPYDEEIQRADLAAEAPALDSEQAAVGAVRSLAG